jgi:hypothetical protein
LHAAAAIIAAEFFAAKKAKTAKGMQISECMFQQRNFCAPFFLFFVFLAAIMHFELRSVTSP